MSARRTRRIILSDEEDESENLKANEQTEVQDTPSNVLTKSLNNLSMRGGRRHSTNDNSDSDFDLDAETTRAVMEGDYFSSRSKSKENSNTSVQDRRQSNRRKSLTKKKENNFNSLRTHLQKSRLDSVLASSDSGQESADDESEFEEPKSNSKSNSYSNSRNIQSPHKSPNRTTKQSPKSSQKLSYTKADFDDGMEYDDDDDNFIVDSEEERLEEEKRFEEKEKRKMERRKRKEKKEKQKAKEKPLSRQLFGSSPNSPNKTRNRRKSMILDSEDEEINPNEEKQTQEEQSEEASEEDSEEISAAASAEESDDAMLYFRVNAELDHRLEEQADAEGPGGFIRKSYELPQAMALYVEMLAWVLLGDEKDLVSSVKYQGAARQIENLISTHRESQVGSTWRPAYKEEMHLRPFFSSFFLSKPPVSLACDACNRKFKDSFSEFKVSMFGPIYDARKVWSINRWVEELPQALFLCQEINSNNSNNNSDQSQRESEDNVIFNATTNSKNNKNQEINHNSPTIVTRNSMRKNKQFQEYQKNSQSTGSKSTKRKLPFDNNNITTGENSSMEGTSTKKRRIIELSDSDSEVSTQPMNIDNNLKTGDFEINSNNDEKLVDMTNDDEIDDDDDDGSKSENSKKSENSVKRPWWQEKWPRELTKEPETSWAVAGHCKGRSYTYHTLLHYKFRLMLKIRGKLQRLYEVNELGGSSKNNKNWAKLTTEQKQFLVDMLINDDKFVEWETHRFQKLIKEADTIYGRSMEERHEVIWSDGESPVKTTKQVSRLQKILDRNGNKILITERRPEVRKQQQNITQWLGK